VTHAAEKSRSVSALEVELLHLLRAEDDSRLVKARELDRFCDDLINTSSQLDIDL
jgi:hypothetical protein